MNRWLENCTTETSRRGISHFLVLLLFFFSTYSNCFFLFLWNKDSLKQSKKKKLFFIPTPIKIIFIYLSFYSFYSSAVPHSHSFSKTRLSDSHRPLPSFYFFYSSAVSPSPTRFIVLLTDLRRPAPFIHHPSSSPSTPRTIADPIPHPPHPSSKSRYVHPSSSPKLSAQ